MNRNSYSFDSNPVSVSMPRSTFDRDSTVLTSLNVGEVVPFFLDEVLPGDTFNVKTSKVVRLQTPITPFMGNLYLDTYYFYVPSRILWTHWKNLMGESNKAWTPSVTYQTPQIVAPSGGWSCGTIADYLGIPTGVDISVNALPFRAYAKIIDDWFRDENLQDPLSIPDGDATVTGVNSNTFVTDIAKGGKPFIASKFRDYFTSCLPSPQKGADVGIGISGTAPVFGDGQNIQFVGNPSLTGLTSRNIGSTGSSSSGLSAFFSNSSSVASPIVNLSGTGAVFSGVPTKDMLATGSTAGLEADLSGATSISINALRLAFSIQRLLEKDARGGTRYQELILAHFRVKSPDSRMQRAEYLGGNRIPISVNQVVQTSETGTTPLGDVAAYSVTTDSNADFIKSFTEHGFIVGVMVARYDHVYQQGLDRLWSRKDRYDYYWPAFAHIGEQAVLNKEIYCDGSSIDDEVFGYNEAWCDYRMKPSKITGEMRSNYATSLDVWHLGDDYNSCPALSDSWIREDKTNVDRVLAVNSSVSNQLFADIYIKNKTSRPMPLHSVPGLIDHF